MCPLRLSKEELLELQKAFFSDAKIARELEVSRQYVGLLRKKYNISSPRSNIKSRNKRVAFEFACKNSVHRISKKFGLSTSHLYKIKRNYEKNNKS